LGHFPALDIYTAIPFFLSAPQLLQLTLFLVLLLLLLLLLLVLPLLVLLLLPWPCGHDGT
jgi:hypothetical protein